VDTEDQTVDIGRGENGKAEGRRSIFGNVLDNYGVKDDLGAVEQVEQVLDIRDGLRKQEESTRKPTESGNEGEEDRLDGIETNMKDLRVEEREPSARGDDHVEERIEMGGGEGGKGKKENGAGSMEEHLTREANGEGGENMRDTTEENKDEYVRSEAEGEKVGRREMEGVRDKEKEKKEDSVPPLWDTVLVQNGDARGTQV